MANDTFKVSIILEAFDRMSGTLKNATNTATRQFADMSKSVQKTSEQVTSLGKNNAISHLTGQTEKAALSMKGLKAEAMSMQEALSAFPLAIMPAMAVVGSVMGPIKEFTDYEDSVVRMKNLITSANGEVSESFTALVEQSKKDSAMYKGSAEDYIHEYTTLMQRGISASDILAGVGKAAAAFQEIRNISYEDAANFVGKAQEAFGVAAKEVPEMIDNINRALNLAGIPVQDMQETIKYLGPSLKVIGQQGTEAAKQWSTVIAEVSKIGGMEGSMAGTNIGMAITQMAMVAAKMDRSQVKKIVGPLLDEYHLSLDFFDKSGQFGGVRNMIEQFQKVMQSGMNQQEQVELFTKLFGQEGEKPAIILGKAGVEGYDKFTKMMADQLSLDKQAAAIRGTLANEWASMVGSAKNVLIALGGIIVNSLAIKNAVKSINEGFSWLAKFIQNNQALSGAILSAAAALLGFKAATIVFGIVGTLLRLTVVSMIKDIVSLASGFLMVGRAIASAGMFMMANPLLLLAVAIAGAAILIYMNWSKISPLLQSVWGKVASAWNSAWNWILSGITWLWNGIKTVLSFIIAAIIYTNPVLFLLYQNWDKMSRAIVSIWIFLASMISSAVGTLVAKIAVLWQAFVAVGTAIVNALLPIWNVAVQVVQGVIQQFNNMFNFLGSLENSMFQAGVNLINSLWQGIMSVINKPIKAISDLAAQIRAHFPFSPAKTGPLRDIHRMRLVQVIAEAINPDPLLAKIRNMASSISNVGMGLPFQTQSRSGSSGSARAPIVINFNPTVNVSGRTEDSKQDIMQALRLHQQELYKIFQDVSQKNSRLVY